MTSSVEWCGHVEDINIASWLVFCRYSRGLVPVKIGGWVVSAERNLLYVLSRTTIIVC
jgi:hypothetical protein